MAEKTQMARELVRGEDPDAALSLNDDLAGYLGLERGPIGEIQGGDDHADYTDELGLFLADNGVPARTTGGAPVVVVGDFEDFGAKPPPPPAHSLAAAIVRERPPRTLASSIVRAGKKDGR